MNFSFLANKVSSTNITQPAQVKKDRKSSKKGQKVYLLPEHDLMAEAMRIDVDLIILRDDRVLRT